MPMKPEYARTYNARPDVRAAKRAWTRTPRGRYAKQKEHAKKRGIEWRFTFEEWIAWWGEDYDKRGRRPFDLCMARYNDMGPYSPTNCIKLMHNVNLQEGRNYGE